MFLFLLVVLLLHSSHSYEVGHGQNWTFVDSKSPVQNDVAKCISGGPEFPCHSLRYAAEQSVKFMGSAFIVLFPEIQLNDSIEFKNASNIKIIGSQKATITCTSNKAGFVFDSVNGIHIANVTIQKCGMYSERNLKSAITVDKCRDVTMRNIVINSSSGAALAFFDTYGEIQIYDSQFLENGVRWSEEQLYVGAVYVSFNQCPVDVYSSYTFQESAFKSNRAVVLTTEARLNGTCSGMGGGLGLFFTGNSCSNMFEFVKCTFQTNEACWGGGMYVGFMDQSCNNSVLVINTTFIQNSASKSGGGAVIGYINSSFSNRIHFSNKTLFAANEATYGGGTGIFASHNKVYSEPGNTITFDNCRWEKNSAYFSSAVDISPHIKDTFTHGFLPVPVFTNCRFIANIVKRRSYNETAYYITEGSFTITRFKVQFGHRIVFQYHKDTALHVTSGIIEFLPGTNASFHRNSGIKGGAIALYGFSSLHFQNNSYFNFKKNTAVEAGGAIYYHPFDQHDFVATQSCFMQYVGPETTYNVTFVFKGNRVSTNHSGYSIYALTLYPCYFQLFDHHDEDEHPLSDSLLSRASFNFDTPLQDALATGAVRFGFNANSSSKTFFVIPGNKLEVPLYVMDEMKSTAHTVYRVSITGKLKTDQDYTVNRKVRIYGKPNQNGNLTLTSLNFREISCSIRVHLLQCPPGFILSKSECICDAHSYVGFTRCNSSHFHAHIRQGYWTGYVMLDKQDQYTLVTAVCPLGFCNYNGSQLIEVMHLPQAASRSVLDNFMCGTQRTGILCGKCRAGYTVYYNSPTYVCREANYCKFGWLFYFLSELVPVTILFVVVLMFNISFTSGSINGFILFSQLLDTLFIDGSGIIKVPQQISFISMGYRVIYGFFSLNLFNTELLSFCLWKGATVLDILAIKYVTIVYSLILISSVIVFMRHCASRMLGKYIKISVIRSSVIHGLSTFIVVCYVQCIKVSLNILLPQTLTARGGESLKPRRVWLDGEIVQFSREHLPYAIPAILVLMTVGAIPPLLLIAYPLLNRLLALCGIGESYLMLSISRKIPISKLKPFFDSFQGCFKDNLRFFAGLYFLYRWVGLLVYASTSSLNGFYNITEAVLIFILLIHAVAHPYETWWHNIVDALLLADLAIINGITVFKYNYSLVHDKVKNHFITINASIQLVLIYLPILLYTTAFILIVCYNKCCLPGLQKARENHENASHATSRGSRGWSTSELEEFPARLLGDTDIDYEAFCDTSSGHNFPQTTQVSSGL